MHANKPINKMKHQKVNGKKTKRIIIDFILEEKI